MMGRTVFAPVRAMMRFPLVELAAVVLVIFLLQAAAACAYARYHPEEIAIVVIKDGIVRSAHKRPMFPWISVSYGEPLRRTSINRAKDQRERVASKLSAIFPEQRVDLKPGERAELFEQL